MSVLDLNAKRSADSSAHSAVVGERLPEQNAGLTRQQEVAGILICALLYVFWRVWGLREAAWNPYFDEGVYLSLMQLQAAGKAQIYRDIVFGHPPAVLWVGGWLWPKVHGSLYALRLVYIAFNTLGFVPMYAIARKLRGPKAALLTLFLMCASPGFANWLGRNIFLELPHNVFIYTALWALVCLPRPRVSVWVFSSVLVGVSFLVKETTIPIIAALAFALWAAARFVPRSQNAEGHAALTPLDGQISRWAWLWVGIFSTATLVLVVALLSRIPHYWEYFVGFYTLSRGTPYQVWSRFYEMTNGFYALPLPLTFGGAGTVLMIRQARNRSEYFLAVFALVSSLILALVPRWLMWRYLMTGVPIFCLGVAVWWQQFTAVPRSGIARRTIFTLLTLFSLVHLASLILFHTHESVTPPGHQAALRILANSPEPVFALNNIWAPASGKLLTPWKESGGDVYGRQRAMLADPASVNTMLDISPTILLDRESERWMLPVTKQYIRQHYTTVFQENVPGNRLYVEILRRR